MTEGYVQLKDKGGSFYHAKLKLTLRGSLPTKVDLDDRQISLLLSNGALMKVEEKVALAILEEQKGKNEVALKADTQRKKRAEELRKGIKSKPETIKAEAEPVADSEEKPDEDKEDTDPKSDANMELFVDKAVDQKVIEKSGTWYKYDSVVIDQGMDETILRIREDEQLYNKIASELK